ncbi:AMP-binding protein [Pseudonocardia sp. KRD-184]|uniref:AMP-binding protein n=1 Tax=Pseudonocardia oceani TaxID=2792013 RepID=A0ABS6U4B3_9PSEU|nr:AMP-binding protein [Pseudonocardia oceani]MBW0090710.1 AMP-binding protein [Pseudonocardia oceani]MBW0097602.1 AMP-binding protein [Pseudonocardia oceani]MBW0124325.1 AMP-binding protein [Pseudonocardia oceani]MBW0127071.1 AMP-binding protein [Pseudonocardia oceani]
MNDVESPEAYVWQPGPDYLGDSPMARVVRRMGARTPEDLYEISIAEPERYWSATMAELDIRWSVPYREFVDLSNGPEWPRWFVGGRMNIVDSALTKWADTRADADALVCNDEVGRSRTVAFGVLADMVGAAAASFRARGVVPGERVAIFAPMCVETAVAYLGALAVGAVVVPLFSGYGSGPVRTRLRDSEASVLVTADGFHRRGRLVPMKDIADVAVAGAPTVGTVVVIGHAGVETTGQQVAGRDVGWDRFMADGAGGDASILPMDPNDPALIIYTSGTTGRPKGTVHYHAGVGLKMAADLTQLTDLDVGCVSIHWSDFGWIVGPGLLLANLIAGATSVVFSGAPDHPGPEQVWRLVEESRATHLWLPPTLVRRLRSTTASVLPDFDLSSLKVLCSTGEAWDAETYRWYSSAVGGDRLPISNYAGGTEIAGGILGCVLSRPIRAGSFNTAVPGMAAAVVDEDGNPVTGRVGELAVAKPFVGMTQGFWGAPERYIETYWSQIPGLWVHGDWAERDADGYWYIRGRSDDTIKVSGKRIGPGEIESAATAHPGVVEAAAVGVPDPSRGSAVVLFVVPDGGAATVSGDAVGESLRAVLEPSSVPVAVHVVPDLPHTRTGKLMRRVVRAVYLGLDPGDLSGLEDPGTIERIALAVAADARAGASR